MKVGLGEVANIQFGLYQKPVSFGEVPYLQAKHFNDFGVFEGEMETFLKSDEKNQSHFLKEGDVILASKGYRNFAWNYKEDFGPAIASSIFFVLNPDRSKVMPEFLSLILNMPETRSYFQNLGAGSSVPSIRKSELEAFTFNLPTLQEQQKIVKFKDLSDTDVELSMKIAHTKRKIYGEVINRLLTDLH